MLAHPKCLFLLESTKIILGRYPERTPAHACTHRHLDGSATKIRIQEVQTNSFNWQRNTNWPISDITNAYLLHGVSPLKITAS